MYGISKGLETVCTFVQTVLSLYCFHMPLAPLLRGAAHNNKYIMKTICYKLSSNVSEQLAIEVHLQDLDMSYTILTTDQN